MSPGYLLSHAKLDWENGTPVSKIYGDIYWHRGAAVEEKTAVFVEPALTLAQSTKTFTIVELGFGFGINCLLTAEHWPADSYLTFISIEKHPVPVEDLKKLLDQFSFRYTDSLLSQYPPAYRGFHTIWLSSGIRLILIFEDVKDALSNLDAEVDFWYLDGFAPARNQDMWAADLYRKMFARSSVGAKIATYSSAGDVRRGLSNAGFEVTRLPGFGKKKNRLLAAKPGRWQSQECRGPSVVIIGAGLAGIYCAEALSCRGIEHTLIDSGTPGPSGIPQLAVFPQLAIAAEAKYRFSLAASQYMSGSNGFHRTGLRWFGRTVDEAERLVQIAAAFPDDIIEAQEDSVLIKIGGWLAPGEIRPENVLVDTVTSIKRTNSLWHCELGSGEKIAADNIVLATGFNRQLMPSELQIRAVRGQAVSVKSQGIKKVLNGQATIFPTYRGRSVVSGTYARSENLEPSKADTNDLLSLAAPLARFDKDDVQPLVGIRSVSRDRLPIVGAIPDWDAISKVNRLSAIEKLQDGLFVCTALGSRGATHARLCAEYLISSMLNEASPLGLKEKAMLSPARFVMRDRKD